ncbi:flippase activity-associated protein Agl23 [Halopenitus persicus]|uniref:TIGR03663 family protein n=1 Tax=Halopenitus persicus TaxID=1048396 RepID=A0A1H3HJN3_9EURY|nr:flippase activity-associated protein Agl23 [Halopenitus persicus]SDY15642.1 TIGR03663 family protein [Halopenitus persicus]
MTPSPDDRPSERRRGRIRGLDPRTWNRNDRRTRAAVATIVVCSLLARTVALGDRPFHWDEARVGYWTLRSLETGSYEYRPVAGGPVVFHLSRLALSVAPPSDALARLPFAIAGGLLPAIALVLRGRLGDDEAVAAAAVLGFAPPLVHYGRFLRGDVIAAGATLLAVGWLVRWTDSGTGSTRRTRYLYGGVVAWAVALGASGFAVATLVLVVAAGLVTLDRPRIEGRASSLGDAARRGGRWLVDRATPLARAAFVFLGTWAVLFLPRGSGGDAGDVPGGLAGLVTDPIGLATRTYAAPVEAFIGVRVVERAGTQFLPFVTGAVSTALATAAPLLAIAVAGFLADRYGLLGGATGKRAAGGRPIVLFASVWAGLGLVGYPVVAEVVAPWTLVHVLVPLAVPAGVGIAAVYRYGRRAAGQSLGSNATASGTHDGREAVTRDAERATAGEADRVTAGDAARVAAAGLVLFALVAHAGIVTLDDVATDPGPESALAQYGQPADDLEPLVGEMEAAIADAEGGNARVVWVGDRFHLSTEAVADRPPIETEADREAWGERLPLPWYLERTGAEVGSVTAPSALEGEPAVVIADPDHEGSLDAMLPAHESRTLRLGLWNREVVVFIAS